MALHMLDEIEPMGDDADLVLLDEAHRAHDIDQQDRALGPRDVVLRADARQIELCHLFPDRKADMLLL